MVVVLAGCAPSPAVVASSNLLYAAGVDDAAAYAASPRRRGSGPLFFVCPAGRTYIEVKGKRPVSAVLKLEAESG